MITIKKPDEIALIRKSGRMLGAILQELGNRAKPGVVIAELDALAEQLIREAGGVPAFKGYRSHKQEPPYPSTICASVNEELVHTPASNRVLKEGDILSIDIGMKYPGVGTGYYTDTAITVPVGAIAEPTKQLLAVTRQSLELGINAVKPGNVVTDISRAIQEYVERHGFSIIRHLVGHGVGYEVHEEPRIPNFVSKEYPRVELKSGMVLAIEPMVSVGDYPIETLDDGWTIVMADRSLCAHFEHTVVVTDDGVEVLTRG